MLAARAPFRIAKNSWRQRPSRGGRRLVRHAPEATAGPAMAPAQFERLAEKLKELKALESVGDALDWDQLVMLPEGGNGLRAKQKSALAAAVHEKSTDPKLGEMIAEAERVKDELDASQAAALREARRAYDMEAKKPAELAKRDAELEAEAYEVWASAKDASNFSQFAPKLDELVSLKKEIATKVRPEMDPYDHMIDLFCRGLSRERVRHILTSIRDGLQPLVAQLKNVKQPDVGPLNHNSGTKFPHEKQIALAREVSAKLGYDFSRGRLDESKHPFTGGLGPHDVRITTRVNESDPLSCLMATIHESGHAIYEQQKSWDHDLLPVQQALDMSVHESQSIIMERMVAQSRAFWEFAAPIVRKHFPELEGVSADAMYRAVNIAKPSLIRVEADELTYPMHIVLRFEIEQRLMAGEITASEVPTEWNKKMRDYLGVDVPDDANGCLQDVHWSIGAYGYFPAYALGQAMAAQLYAKALKEIPDLEKRVAQGDFSALREWLRERVHSKGSLYPSCDDLCESITGEKLNPQHLVDHLTDKYKELYNL